MIQDVPFKEKCRIYYMVKGNLCRTHRKQIEEAYPGYFKRCWHNEEAYLYQEGFEENYRAFMMGVK